MPPFLAGREGMIAELDGLFGQVLVMRNAILTGLRGLGKTVLLEAMKPRAMEQGWLWVGADLSESASIDERSLAVRLLTDLAVVTSAIVAGEYEEEPFGLSRRGRRSEVRLSSEVLLSMYDHAPGLASDKLKHVLETAAEHVKATGKRGLVFAYDEAQNLADHAAKDQFRLSLLLDVFQSIQRKGVPAMLVLTGLPTLMPQLVAARTYTERMFRVVTLERLSEADSHEAVTRPLRGKRVKFDETTVSRIVAESAGYPYFIQFICRELMDLFLQGALSVRKPFLPMTEIMKKLDADFFAGRWAAATDRQRELLLLVAGLETVESEFTVKQIVVAARKAAKRTFSASHVVQMLSALADIGLAYKNRHGRYSLAVPLLNRFIVRQFEGDATARTEKKLAGPKARRVVRRTKKRRVGSRSGRG